jgi:ABC-2 type transport system ATP-binding protein
MNDIAIHLDGLVKRYKPGLLKSPVRALNGLSLSVRRGEVHALIGPNGAGKTTAFRILLGFLRADAGGGAVLGHPLGSMAARERIGYLPETPTYYPFLTVRELLRLGARLSRVPDPAPAVEETLERFDLIALRDRPLRKLSKGQLQRVGLAQAGLHRPDLLILDEPMSGLDPYRRAEVKDWIRALRREGRTVLLSSHVLGDVEALADRVSLILSGRLTIEGTPDELLETSDFEVEIQFALPGSPDTVLAGLSAHVEERGGLWVARMPGNPEIHVSALVSRILHHGGRLHGLARHRPDLEGIYLSAIRSNGTERERDGGGR